MNPACTHCDLEMEPGFMVDAMHGGITTARWCPGVPERSFWIGIKQRVLKRAVAVSTFRCPRCGYLESYAHPAAAPAVSGHEQH